MFQALQNNDVWFCSYVFDFYIMNPIASGPEAEIKQLVELLNSKKIKLLDVLKYEKPNG